MKDDGSEVQEDLSYMMEPPRDLHEMYMRLRAQLSSSKTFYSCYMKLSSLVDVGAQLLPLEYKALSDEVSEFLTSDLAFPGERQMEASGNLYRMGGERTGLILVHERDIDAGRNEALEQQMTSLLPKLRYYDIKVHRVLIGCGVVEKKRPILEDLLIDQTMGELGDMIREKQRKEQEGGASSE